MVVRNYYLLSSVCTNEAKGWETLPSPGEPSGSAKHLGNLPALPRKRTREIGTSGALFPTPNSRGCGPQTTDELCGDDTLKGLLYRIRGLRHGPVAEASHALLFCTQLQNRLTRWPRESHEERYPLSLLTCSWEGEEDRSAAESPEGLLLLS